MANIQPDFSQEVIPPKPGVYRAKVVSFQQKQSEYSDYLNWKLLVDTPHGQFNLFHTTPLNGKGAGFLRRFIEAFNPNYNGGAFDPDSLIGRTVRVALKDEVGRDGQKTGYLRINEAMLDQDSSPFPEPAASAGSNFNEADIPF